MSKKKEINTGNKALDAIYSKCTESEVVAVKLLEVAIMKQPLFNFISNLDLSSALRIVAEIVDLAEKHSTEQATKESNVVELKPSENN